MFFHDAHQILKLRIAAVHSEFEITNNASWDIYLDDAMAYFNLLSWHFPWKDSK